MQTDGNFVIYDWTHGGRIEPVWSTNTKGSGASQLVLQRDGNLVLYTNANKPVWSTGTQWVGQGPYRLELQADRNLVLRDGKRNVIWSSKTNK